MKTTVKAKRMGGSIGVLLPKAVVERERIAPHDTLRISVERADDLTFLWGTLRTKRRTQEILDEIDEGES